MQKKIKIMQHTYFTNSGNLSPLFPSPADGELHCYLQNQKITKKIVDLSLL
jgi:hypothetical protein